MSVLESETCQLTRSKSKCFIHTGTSGNKSRIEFESNVYKGLTIGSCQTKKNYNTINHIQLWVRHFNKQLTCSGHNHNKSNKETEKSDEIGLTYLDFCGWRIVNKHEETQKKTNRNSNPKSKKFQQSVEKTHDCKNSQNFPNPNKNRRSYKHIIHQPKIE